jgi:LacI family transcriptional regulator
VGKVTSRDVAREAGVSQNTVSLVVRHSPRVRAETRLAVEEAMARLHYQPNAVASALRSQTTQSLAFVVAAGDLHNHVTAELLAGAVEGAAAHDYTVVAVPSPPDDRGAAVVTLFRRQKISGALVFAPATDAPLVATLAAADCPTVSLLQPSSAIPLERSVTADDYGGGAAAVRHLLERGHRRLGLIGVRAGETNAMARARMAAARAVTAAAGLPLDVALAGDWSVEAGRAAAAELLARPARPSAIFAISDRLAFGVLQAAGAAGLAVPADLAVVGFDNVEWAQYCSPPLTTVEFPLRDVAIAGVDRLLGNDPATQWTSAPARLMVRESS